MQYNKLIVEKSARSTREEAAVNLIERKKNIASKLNNDFFFVYIRAEFYRTGRLNVSWIGLWVISRHTTKNLAMFIAHSK